jgi:hypothetical protein
MKIKGKVKFISEATTGTSKAGKDWAKQSVVIEEDGQYPNSAVIEFFNKEINFEVGDIVEMEFNIKATEFNGRYFTNISAWQWTVEARQKQKEPEADPFANYGQRTVAPPPTGDDPSDDLPF